jgi:hypothetical protein
MQRYTGLFFDLAHNLFWNFSVSANGRPEDAMTIIRLGVASTFLKCEPFIGQYLQDIFSLHPATAILLMKKLCIFLHTVKNVLVRVNARMPETGVISARCARKFGLVCIGLRSPRPGLPHSPITDQDSPAKSDNPRLIQLL